MIELKLDFGWETQDDLRENMSYFLVDHPGDLYQDWNWVQELMWIGRRR